MTHVRVSPLSPQKCGDFFWYNLVYSETFHIFVGMSNELIIVLVFFWMVSAAYVMYTHKKEYTLGLDMIIGAILLGPILALFVKDGGEHEIKKLHIEQEENNRHRRWFRTMGEINRQRTSTWFRTIPPPPPISRIERARTERDEAIRSATERIDKNKLKDFKFLRTNVKD